MADVLHENKLVRLAAWNKPGFANIDSCFVLIGTRHDQCRRAIAAIKILIIYLFIETAT